MVGRAAKIAGNGRAYEFWRTDVRLLRWRSWFERHRLAPLEKTVCRCMEKLTLKLGMRNEELGMTSSCKSGFSFLMFYFFFLIALVIIFSSTFAFAQEN